MSPMDLQPGQYELIILGWTKDQENKPDLQSRSSFVIEESIYREYKKHIEGNLSLPLLATLGDSRLPNNVITKKGLRRHFGQDEIK